MRRNARLGVTLLTGTAPSRAAPLRNKQERLRKYVDVRNTHSLIHAAESMARGGTVLFLWEWKADGLLKRGCCRFVVQRSLLSIDNPWIYPVGGGGRVRLKDGQVGP